jgi:hypothetical protein
MFKVHPGAEVRLGQCRLAVPLDKGLKSFQSMVHLHGGDPGERAAPAVSINESILLGGPAVVAVQGEGRLRVRQSVVVAGQDVVRADLSRLAGATADAEPDAVHRLRLFALFENSTFAIRGALFDLKDAPAESGPREPAVVQALGNWFVDPFTDSLGSCLVRCEAATLTRGELLWQGRGNAFDKRLRGTVTLPGRAEPQPFATWQRLWGSPGESRPLVVDVPGGDKSTMSADNVLLERLLFPPQARPTVGDIPGANLVQLGILKKAK